MSRSRKKYPHFTHTDKKLKQYANKRYRRRPLDLTNISFKKYTDRLDFRDWIFRGFGLTDRNMEEVYKYIMK